VNEKTRKLIVYGLLVAAVIWGVYNFEPGRKRSHGPSANAPAVAAAMTAAVPGPAATIDIETEAARSWGEDPFRVVAAPARQSERAPSWNLGGIIYSASAPLAIINNRTVGVGDEVGGATVVKIDRTQVTLDHAGKAVTLKVASRG